LASGFDEQESSAIDIVGMQEVQEEYIDKFLEVIRENGPEQADWVLVRHGVCGTIYNKSTMGHAESVSIECGKSLRCVQGLFFRDSGLLHLNAWFEHYKNVITTIEKISLPADIEPTRVIITMDSNDFSGLYRTYAIKLANLTLKIPGETKQKTCCEDSGYHYVGDYIFDSEYAKAKYYGIPKNINPAKEQLMSDHLPVLLRTSHI
jgi:hypothetical protein